MVLGYIDPGAGSLIIQALIAAMLSVPFLLRKRLASVADKLRRTGSDNVPTGDHRS